MKLLIESWRDFLTEDPGQSQELLKEISADQWVSGMLDWIYGQLPEGGLEEATPTIVAALQEVIETLHSPEANPEDGGMYGEEEY